MSAGTSDKRQSLLRRAAVTLAALGVVGTALPAWSLSAQGTVHVSVSRHVSVANLAPLEFGEVSVNSVPGSVTLNPDGSRSSSGGVMIDGAGSASAARFLVEGMAGLDYEVQLPGQVVIGDGKGNTMVVDNLVVTSSRSASESSPGMLELLVGGRLNLKENQSVGDYTGAMVVEISYR